MAASRGPRIIGWVIWRYASVWNFWFELSRKADLRELKLLQKQENRLMQATDAKAQQILDEQTRKQELEKQVGFQWICQQQV